MKPLHFLLPFLLSLFAFNAQANTQMLVPEAPRVDARSHTLIDYDSGRVLAESNADERMEPASLTKLMTAYVVFNELRSGQIKLSDKVRVSKKAWRTPGSRMFIEVDHLVDVESLLKGMIIQSGNDASVALAEYVAGSEEVFAALMNEHAQRLGLYGSHFTNSTGLPDPDHYTSAKDMATLAVRMIRDFPEYYHWYSEKDYTYGKITQGNRNLLLYRDKTVDGLKTGHTDSAGYCLVVSALRNDMRLISVVMGTKSESARANESQKLLNYGFRFFETHKLYDAVEPLKSVRVWKGASDAVALGMGKAFYTTVPRGQYNKLNVTVSTGGKLVAPIKKGQTLGQINVHLGDTLLAEHPLIALDDVAEGSLFQRLLDSVKMLWQ